MATDDALWIGISDPETKILKSAALRMGLKPEGEISGWMKFPIPEEVLISTRMHLSRDQIKQLMPILQSFVDTRELPADDEHLPRPLTEAEEEYTRDGYKILSDEIKAANIKLADQVTCECGPNCPLWKYMGEMKCESTIDVPNACRDRIIEWADSDE